MASQTQTREGFELAEHEDRLAWIFGSSRSGSTWLLEMLGDIQGVVTVDDPHLGHHLGVWRPIPLAWAAADDAPELTTLLEIKRDRDGYFFADRYRDRWAPALRELILTRFQAQVEDAERRDPGEADPVVVVKEPGSQAAELLLELFPRSGLVFLLRDGRDVVDSWVAAYRPGAWALDEGAFPASREGRLSLIRWQAEVWAHRTQAVLRAYESHPAGRKVLVRYEDLRRDPATELARICDTLGLEATPDRLDEVARAHSLKRVPARERGTLRPVRAARPGGWRTSLNDAEVDAMMEALGPTLELAGYEPGSARPELRADATRV